MSGSERMEKSLDQLIASSGNSFVDTFIKKTHLVKHLNNDIIKIREATSYPIKKALGQAKKNKYAKILHEDQRQKRR